jgi:hypothetical protein
MGICIGDAETRVVSLLWEGVYPAVAEHRTSPKLWLAGVWINVGGSHKPLFPSLQLQKDLAQRLKSWDMDINKLNWFSIH